MTDPALKGVEILGITTTRLFPVGENITEGVDVQTGARFATGSYDSNNQILGFVVETDVSHSYAEHKIRVGARYSFFPDQWENMDEEEKQAFLLHRVLSDTYPYFRSVIQVINGFFDTPALTPELQDMQSMGLSRND